MGRTLLPAAIVAAVALAAAPAGLAKGPLQVCGASGCAALGPETDTPTWLGAAPGASSLPPPAPAPYFVLRFSDIAATVAYWIPSASIMRTVQSNTIVWVGLAPDAEAALIRLTAGLQPYAAPKRAAAFIDYENVKGGTTYMRLYTIGTPIESAPSSTVWLAIWLHGGKSPWNDGMSSFWISKTGSLLKRDGQILQIAPPLAKRIRAHQPLA
jgi:hypothetical protein